MEAKSGVRVMHCIIDNIYNLDVSGVQMNKKSITLTEYEGTRDGPISHSSREKYMRQLSHRERQRQE